MTIDLKPYIYTRGKDAALDAEFVETAAYAKVKLGKSVLFWKAGLRWCGISFANVRRIFRRVEPVYGKLCCGRQSYIIERLVLILSDGSELEIYLGDDVKRQAEELYDAIRESHPELQFGKV